MIVVDHYIFQGDNQHVGEMLNFVQTMKNLGCFSMQYHFVSFRRQCKHYKRSQMMKWGYFRLTFRNPHCRFVPTARK